MTAAPTVPKRRYDNALRRERAAQTSERIVTAGAELVRASSISDWHGVTIRAVAARAGVNERTVYRHFANERALRDAVMQRLEEQAGIDLESMRLDEVGDVASRIFQHVSSYPRARRKPLDPTLIDANRRQHDALLDAVAQHAESWSEGDRRLAAAALDVLWAVGSYERLVVDWEMDAADATRAITWAIATITTAIHNNHRPSS